MSKSRDALMWGMLQPFIAALSSDLRDQAQVSSQARLDNAQSAIQAALQNKAPLQHTHAPADVNGLPATVVAFNTRITALETAVALIKQRLGL